MPHTKRLFIGFPLPEELRSALSALDPQVHGLRWLPSEQLHLTLSFIGDADGPHQEALTAALAGVHVKPFFLPLSGTGSFSAKGALSVVWVGVGNGHPHLFALRRQVQDAVIRAGLEPDLRPFHPHVSVGRAKGISKQAVQPFLRDHAQSEFGLIRVGEFVLYSSVLRGDGAAYSVEARFALA